MSHCRVPAGWARGYVNGRPSSAAPNPNGAIRHFNGYRRPTVLPAVPWRMLMYGVGQAADYAKTKALFEGACKAKCIWLLQGRNQTRMAGG